jgi:hypothetical protein
MEAKLGEQYNSVDVEIIGSQEMLKLVSVRLEMRLRTTHHISECCSQHGRSGSQTEGNSTNRAGRHRVPFFSVNNRLIHNY